MLCHTSQDMITIAYSVSRDQVAAIASPGFAADLGIDMDQVKIATSEVLENVLRDAHLTKILFAGEIISAGLDVLEPCVENIPAFFACDRAYTIGKDSLSLCSSEFWQVDSFGMVFLLILHGKASAETAMSHVVLHAQRVVQICPQEVPVTINFGIVNTLGKEEFLSLCEKLPFFAADKVMIGDYVVTEYPIREVKQIKPLLAGKA